MPRISKVRDTKLNLDYGFMFDIRTHSECFEWYDKVRLSIGIAEYKDASRSHEWSGQGYHVKDGATLVVMAQSRGISLVHALAELNSTTLAGMYRVLESRGQLFINSRGGYFGLQPCHEVTDTREVEGFILPGDKIRVIKWPEGKHYYAKIGNTDVVVDGRQKWDTEAEARLAAQKFLQLQEASCLTKF